MLKEFEKHHGAIAGLPVGSKDFSNYIVKQILLFIEFSSGNEEKDTSCLLSSSSVSFREQLPLGIASIYEILHDCPRFTDYSENNIMLLTNVTHFSRSLQFYHCPIGLAITTHFTQSGLNTSLSLVLTCQATYEYKLHSGSVLTTVPNPDNSLTLPMLGAS